MPDQNPQPLNTTQVPQVESSIPMHAPTNISPAPMIMEQKPKKSHIWKILLGVFILLLCICGTVSVYGVYEFNRIAEIKKAVSAVFNANSKMVADLTSYSTQLEAIKNNSNYQGSLTELQDTSSLLKKANTDFSTDLINYSAAINGLNYPETKSFKDSLVNSQTKLQQIAHSNVVDIKILDNLVNVVKSLLKLGNVFNGITDNSTYTQIVNQFNIELNDLNDEKTVVEGVNNTIPGNDSIKAAFVRIMDTDISVTSSFIQAFKSANVSALLNIPVTYKAELNADIAYLQTTMSDIIAKDQALTQSTKDAQDNVTIEYKKLNVFYR